MNTVLQEIITSGAQMMGRNMTVEAQPIICKGTMPHFDVETELPITLDIWSQAWVDPSVVQDFFHESTIGDPFRWAELQELAFQLYDRSLTAEDPVNQFWTMQARWPNGEFIQVSSDVVNALPDMNPKLDWYLKVHGGGREFTAVCRLRHLLTPGDAIKLMFEDVWKHVPRAWRENVDEWAYSSLFVDL